MSILEAVDRLDSIKNKLYFFSSVFFAWDEAKLDFSERESIGVAQSLEDLFREVEGVKDELYALNRHISHINHKEG